MTEDNRQPISEEAALRELERLQLEIEQARGRRRDANDAFDRFLRSFERQTPPPLPEPPEWAHRRLPIPPFTPPPREDSGPAAAVEVIQPEVIQAAPVAVPPAVEVAPPPPPVLPAPRPPEAENVASDLGFEPETWAGGLDGLVRETEPPTATASAEALPAVLEPPPPETLELDAWERDVTYPPPMAAFPAESEGRSPAATLPAAGRPIPAALTAAAPRRGQGISPVAGVIGLLLVGALAFYGWRAISGDSGAPTDTAAVETAGAPSTAPGPQAPAPAPAPPVQAASTAIVPAAEVVTVRRAWVRVTLDGRKVLEQELPADSRYPLPAGSQFVVRAGDAGAVRVVIGGKDQGPVGRDGEVATRSFKMAPAGPR